MKKIFLVNIFIIFIVFFNNALSYNQLEIKLYYDKIYSHLENTKKEGELVKTLSDLDKKLTTAISKTKNKDKLSILRQIYSLNKSKISLLEGKNKELYYINELKKVYKYLELSSNFEYIKESKYYRFNFSKYYSVSEKNYKSLINEKIKDGYLLKHNNQYYLVGKYEIEEKYFYSDLISLFSNYLDLSKPYSLNNGAYYSYNYSNYSIFDNIEGGVYLTDLLENGIDSKNTLLVKDKNSYYFVNNYQKIRLVGEDLTKNVTNKDEFLYNIFDDSKFFPSNYDNVLRDIKNNTNTIISGVTDEKQKIKLIYNWITSNTTYYEKYLDGNKQVFSGILTYKNKTGVCDGYTKLFLYMLSFAGIDNVEVKRGFAFDNTDFPNFGHAWVKIGDNYYDPTFDDPIGGNGKNEYYYFGIPYELMYVNRFDGTEIPNNLKNMSLGDRKNLVLENMYKIYDKYKDYSIMNKIKNRIFLGLSYNESLSLSKLSTKMPYFEVNTDFTYLDNGKNKQIKSLNYYPINSSNIESIVLTPNLNLENMYLFKWYNKNGTFDYRLAYDVITN